MGKYIWHRLVARQEPVKTLWTDSTAVGNTHVPTILTFAIRCTAEDVSFLLPSQF